MFGRSNKKRHHRAGLFMACRRCHDEIIPTSPIKTQVAIKKAYDPEGWEPEVAKELYRSKTGRIDLEV